MASTKPTSKAAADKAPATRKPRAASTKSAAEKKPSTRKSAASATAAAAGKLQMSAEERYRMVEVAAYYLAERNNFAGSPVEYWSQAEAQISSLLGE
jgi:hypothetical protein